MVFVAPDGAIDVRRVWRMAKLFGVNPMIGNLSWPAACV